MLQMFYLDVVYVFAMVFKYFSCVCLQVFRTHILSVSSVFMHMLQVFHLNDSKVDGMSYMLQCDPPAIAPFCCWVRRVLSCLLWRYGVTGTLLLRGWGKARFCYGDGIGRASVRLGWDGMGRGAVDALEREQRPDASCGSRYPRAPLRCAVLNFSLP
jgi:hypothetical protein